MLDAQHSPFDAEHRIADMAGADYLFSIMECANFDAVSATRVVTESREAQRRVARGGQGGSREGTLRLGTADIDPLLLICGAWAEQGYHSG